MCNTCENDYEQMALKYAEDLTRLENRIDALEKALKIGVSCYKNVADQNYSLICQNINLQKKDYYDHRTQSKGE